MSASNNRDRVCRQKECKAGRLLTAQNFAVVAAEILVSSHLVVGGDLDSPVWLWRTLQALRGPFESQSRLQRNRNRRALPAGLGWGLDSLSAVIRVNQKSGSLLRTRVGSPSLRRRHASLFGTA